MLVCNLKPADKNICMDCIDTQINSRECKSCTECMYTCEDYILLSVGTTIFGKGYAIVAGGPTLSATKVPLSRVIGIRENYT